MAEYGVATWDGSGVPNNYGIKPVSVAGFLRLNAGQKNGSISVTVPPGCKVQYFQVSVDDGYGSERRKINISGGNITVSAVGDTDYSAGTEPAVAAFVIIQIVRS